MRRRPPRSTRTDTLFPYTTPFRSAPISTMQGGLPPWMNIQGDFAKQIKKALVHFGIEKQPLGIDVMELPMLRALAAEGIEVVDGQQALLAAREFTTTDEIELLKMDAVLIEDTYVYISQAFRP